MAKTLNLADVIEGLESVIEEWGDDAFGGDTFAEIVSTSVNEWGMPTYKEAPVCLVGTYLSDFVEQDFEPFSLAYGGEYKLSKDADEFLTDVVAGVDGEDNTYMSWQKNPQNAKENPTRSWRQGLDYALTRWGLA